MKKLLLPIACGMLMLTSCAKEEVAPQPLAAVTHHQNSFADDYNADSFATGRTMGAADANYLAAGYSTGGDNGPLSTDGGQGIGGQETNGGPNGGVLIDPGDAASGGVGYGSGHTAHSYNFPGDNLQRFQNELSNIRANAVLRQQQATTPDQVLYYQGYIEGVDGYLMI